MTDTKKFVDTVDEEFLAVHFGEEYRSLRPELDDEKFLELRFKAKSVELLHDLRNFYGRNLRANNILSLETKVSVFLKKNQPNKKASP